MIATVAFLASLALTTINALPPHTDRDQSPMEYMPSEEHYGQVYRQHEMSYPPAEFGDQRPIQENVYGAHVRQVHQGFGQSSENVAPFKYDMNLVSRTAKHFVCLPGVSLRNGDVITLKADNGMYFKRFSYFPWYPLASVLAYQTHVDAFSKFTVEVVGENKIHLKAENGKYLKRLCCYAGISIVSVILDKPDAFSVFTVEGAGHGKIRLTAENGAYLKRVYYTQLRKNVLGVLNVRDQYGVFDVDLLSY